MFFTIKDFLEDTTGKISARSQTRAAGVVAVSLLLSTLGLLFVKHNIGINTDTENMLSERLPWRSTYTEFKSHFPFFADTVLIVVEGTTPDVAEDAARELAVNVAKDKQHFHSVFHAAEHEFFRRQQLLYLSEPALFELTDNLSRTQAVLAQLMNEPSGRQLLETLNLALERDAEDQKLERLQVMLANAINKATEGVFEPMSWRRLLASSEHESKGGKDSRVLFTAKPILDYADIMPANAAINALHNISSELEAKYPGLLRIGITGGAALAHDEMSSVIRGSLKAGSFALLMVLACLFIGLRSWVLVFSTLLSLIIGLIFTASFAVAAVGTLNMISIAFAVLYVGLGVDFAIHTCLRYRELIPKNRSSADKFNLINAATRQVGASIALCAMTTSIGFFAFIPTDFKGVAELGLIAGVGMFISLAVTIIVLPAILQCLPLPQLGASNKPNPWRPAIVTAANAKLILAVAGCLWFVTSISISFIEFDINPINLNDQQSSSVRLMRDLSKDGNFSLYSVSSLVDDISALTETTATLNDIVSVDSVTNIHSLVPKDQSEKFLILDELNLVLGDNLAVADRGEFDSEALLEEVRALKTSLSRLEKNAMSDASASLLSSITKLLSMLDNLDPVTRSQRLELVDRNMMTSFKDRIERLSDGLNASEVTIDNLPEDVRRLWLSDRGKYRVEATPREDLSDNYALQAFVDEIREAVGDKATGTAVINVGAAQAVQAAFIQAFCYALGLISILLWLVLRSFKELLVTIFPLLLAGLITSGAIVLFELKLNFANVIALPLLLGIGVDSAIHLLHRYKTELEPTRSILQTSTARAVFFSAATTTVSFGNLALTDHAGTASMGIVLTIGIISVLFCMLIVLPAMMIAFVERANP